MKTKILEKSCLKLLYGVFLAAFGMTMATNSLADPTNNYIKNNLDGSQTLRGHVAYEVKNSTAVFKSHANININAQVIMSLGNQAQLNTLLQDLYNPKSPNFHQFLTPAQFAQQFAPSSIDATLVQEYLNSKGIAVTGQSAGGAVLNVTGPVRAFEQAFDLHINNYQKSDGTLFYGPDADPTVPANLAGKIRAVGGLDDLPRYKAHNQQVPMIASSKAVGSGPGGYLAPNDVKKAYNLNSITSTGSGQSIALFELDGYASRDITSFESEFGLPNVPLQNVLVDGFSGTPDFASGGADEVTIDIEVAAAFASGSNILVYEAPNTTSAWIAEWTRIASDDKAKVVSCSWGEPEMDSATLTFDSTIFAQMAAQGQAVFVAAGDSGAYDAGGSTLAVDEPASQPFATAVGISKLTTSGGAYSSETASVDGGGGTSAVWSIPSYQTAAAAAAASAAKVSKTMRNLPDVVLTADPSTPYSFYVDGSWSGWWGSSISAPVWASFISRVNQGLGDIAPIGSVNTLLYQLAQNSTSDSNDFHDITTGNNGYYKAEPGFDDASGLGSFNGLNLYNDLLKAAVAAMPPAAPAGLSAVAGNTQVSLSWTASAGASSYDVKRSTVSGGPYTTIASPVLNTTYTDTSVTDATTYYYVVSAVNTAGQGANSSQVSATSMPPMPSAPVGLSATASNGQVVLSWTAVTGAASYNVKRATVSGGAYTTIASSVAATTYTDKSVSNGDTYYYVVSAVNVSGQGANSAQVSAIPSVPAPVAMVAPANLIGSVSGNTGISLRWTQSISANIKSNNLYFSIGSGTYTKLGSMSAATSAMISGASSGTTYNFYVTAVNSSGVESAASNKITVIMPR